MTFYVNCVGVIFESYQHGAPDTSCNPIEVSVWIITFVYERSLLSTLDGVFLYRVYFLNMYIFQI